MQNKFIIANFLFFIKLAQSQKLVWITYKKDNTVIQILTFLLKHKLILGFFTRKKKIIIFLKYFGTLPSITSYKIFSKPTKKVLLSKKKILQLRKNNCQSFFILYNNTNFYNLQSIKISKIKASILFLKIN